MGWLVLHGDMKLHLERDIQRQEKRGEDSPDSEY